MAATVRRLCTVAGEGWVVVGVGWGWGWGGLDFVMLFRVTPVAGSCLALNLHRRPLRQQPCCNRQPPASMAPSCTTSNCLCACIGFCSITARIPLSGFLLRCKHLSSRRPSLDGNRGQVMCKSRPGVKVVESISRRRPPQDSSTTHHLLSSSRHSQFHEPRMNSTSPSPISQNSSS